MEEVLKGSSSAVFLFLYLFPGFLGSLLYDFLVEGRKRENFVRIIVALTLTLLTSVTLKFLIGLPLLPLAIDEKAPISSVIDGFFGRNFLYATVLSAAIATALAWSNNTGTTFAVLRFLGITNKTSSVDVWTDTLGRFRGYWVVIRFRDGRSLTGWPRYYSLFGDPREIFLADATWSEAGENGTVLTQDVAGPGVYIADFTSVVAIEVLNGE
jgi:hypothetical protein